jgi:hypothetical protein
VTFSDRALPPETGAMHVDVAGGLPKASEWPLHAAS